MLVLLHSPPLDGACSQARKENSLELFCYTWGTAIPPQPQLLHAQSFVDSIQPHGGCHLMTHECGSRLNPFTESVDVYSSVSFAICYDTSCWTWNRFHYPYPLPLGVQFASCWQIPPYSVTHLETSLLLMLVV